MLPNISLDTERYKDLINDARNMIVNLYPEWTDFNYHDPGITLLELFAWIKENQQYFIDQVGNENRKKYLKLLGFQPRTKVPARAEVELAVPQDISVLKGTKFYSGEICFEAEEDTYILKNDISRCISHDGEQARVVNHRQADLGNKLKIWPFGREPRAGSCFYLGFDEPLPQNTILRALIDVFNDYEVRRVPIIESKAFYPLAEFILEANTQNGWRTVTVISDDTHELLCSGSIKFWLDFAMESCVVEKLEGYYLRLRLIRCDYDVPPVVQAIRFNSLIVRQRDTQSEIIDFPLASDGKYCAATELSISGISQLFVKVGQEYQMVPEVIKSIDYENNRAVFAINISQVPAGADGLRLVNCTNTFANRNIVGFGTGFPFQEFELNHEDIEYGSFELMTEDTENANHFLPWVKVRDFSVSTPEDRHYILDSAAGIVKFGDCINGMAPEGTILIVGYVSTLGSGGNVRQNTINQIGAGDIPDIEVINKADAAGGENEESLDDCFQRARRMLRNPRSAVTYSDYENCVLETPGLMIESCQVIPANLFKQRGNAATDMTVNIVVKPFRPERAENISEAYICNIQSHLDSFRLIGTNIELVAPEYISVTVYADVTVKPHYLHAQALVEEAVRNFFFRYKDLFGAEIIYGELYGTIDRLECVSSVSALSMDVKGNGISRTKEGNIVLPANGVVVLSNTEYLLSVIND